MPARKITDATANAVEAEAVDALVTFDFEGGTYRALPSSEWTWDALEAYETGRITAFVGAILDPASLAAFKATKPKVATVTDFVLAIQKALGIQGN